MTAKVNSSITRLALSSALVFLCACNNSGSSSIGSCEAPFINKVQLPELARVAAESGQTPRLAAGTKVVAVLRDACTEPGAIASSIPDRYEGVTRSGVRSYEWEIPYAVTFAELEEMAENDPCVQMISESGEIELPKSDAGISLPAFLPDDPKVPDQKHLQPLGTSEAFDIFFDPKNGIKVPTVIAIVDSGVRLDHEDLHERLWINEDEIPGNGIDDDQNGYVDDYYGYNFASRIPDPSPQKSSANGSWQWAHGTRVAGLAAATSGNRIGITGIAPNAKIMALNAMGTSAGFSQASLANAIRYAVDNGAKVINLSLGGNSGQTADFKQAIEYAIQNGAVVLAAAGNEGSSIGSSYSAAGLAPLFQGLISVGNYQAANFQKSSGSNYSTTYVKLSAPGTYDSSTLLLTTSSESASAYSMFSGTSASVPVAAGAAALAIGLLESRGYHAPPAVVESLLLESALKIDGLKSYFKDGNALHLESLGQLINKRYPAIGLPPITGGNGKPVTGSNRPSC